MTMATTLPYFSPLTVSAGLLVLTLLSYRMRSRRRRVVSDEARQYIAAGMWIYNRFSFRARVAVTLATHWIAGNPQANKTVLVLGLVEGFIASDACRGQGGKSRDKAWQARTADFVAKAYAQEAVRFRFVSWLVVRGLTSGDRRFLGKVVERKRESKAPRIGVGTVRRPGA